MFMKTSINAIQIKKCKVLLVFGDMIADILSKQNFESIVTELFIRSRKIFFSLFVP